MFIAGIIVVIFIFIIVRKIKKSNRNSFDEKSESTKKDDYSYNGSHSLESNNHSSSNSYYSKNINSNYCPQTESNRKKLSYGYNKNGSYGNKYIYNNNKKRRENYNALFEDLMNDINNTAQGLGFKNGVKWAKRALRQDEITYADYKKYRNCHDMRNRLSHGNARDIFISYKTYSYAQHFEYDINNSYIRFDYYFNKNKKTKDYLYKQ